jgi:hypothetical protein
MVQNARITKKLRILSLTILQPRMIITGTSGHSRMSTPSKPIVVPHRKNTLSNSSSSPSSNRNNHSGSSLLSRIPPPLSTSAHLRTFADSGKDDDECTNFQPGSPPRSQKTFTPRAVAIRYRYMVRLIYVTGCEIPPRIGKGELHGLLDFTIREVLPTVPRDLIAILQDNNVLLLSDTSLEPYIVNLVSLFTQAAIIYEITEIAGLVAPCHDPASGDHSPPSTRVVICNLMRIGASTGTGTIMAWSVSTCASKRRRVTPSLHHGSYPARLNVLTPYTCITLYR